MLKDKPIIDFLRRHFSARSISYCIRIFDFQRFVDQLEAKTLTLIVCFLFTAAQ